MTPFQVQYRLDKLGRNLESCVFLTTNKSIKLRIFSSSTFNLYLTTELNCDNRFSFVCVSRREVLDSIFNGLDSNAFECHP